jgi:hypothetical protein
VDCAVTCCLTAFPFGATVSGCHTRIRGKGAVSTAWIVVVDLPHSQHPRPKRCSRKGLSWTQCVKGDFRDGWSGSISSFFVPDVLYSATSLSESITISRIWFRDNRRARLSHQDSLRCILQRKTVATFHRKLTVFKRLSAG